MTYKITPKKKVIEWIEKTRKEHPNVFAATYLEVYHSSKSSCVHIIVNTDKGQETIMRVSRNFFDWYETEKVRSTFINVSLYKIGKRSEAKREKPEQALSLFNLIS